ncbi:hypothetical protein KDA_58650 [Dictyobacter alpinus]|uniref:DUF6602 domain-containing protein n=1 Tax=Dictyobacter alpinus TaxID=2014873 RepID=A0A402BG34_9CHLR|nr:DUF6602 domain-containing protein [Dictyobacter alpinus]GCE30381.1 hypothetical protein KDA_58650 [Dictyobacter alpinus]
MTDIKKHLPAILSCIRFGVFRSDPLEVMKSELRQLLPASYGIVAAGHVANKRQQQSALLDLIIYDTTIPVSSTALDETVIDIAQVLLVVVLVDKLDRSALASSLQRVASVKTLTLTQEKSTKKASVWRKLQPLGAVIFNRLVDAASDCSGAWDANDRSATFSIGPNGSAWTACG